MNYSRRVSLTRPWLALALLAFAAPVTRAADATTSPNLRYYYPLPAAKGTPQIVEADVCVYGGTSGGAAAAIQASRMGKSAVLLEFGAHIGGLTSGGLSATDGGSAAGGIAREFYNKVGHSGFKPAAAERAYLDMLKEANVPVRLEHRLIAVEKDGNRITVLRCENGVVVRAKAFIDATYEGDLMAAAGVAFHVGREANAVYDETLNGVAFHGGHTFSKQIDPYVVPGDPKSGLLWGVQDVDPGKKGDGDKKVQAYNFRMYLVKGGLPFPKPTDYDPKKYELDLRYMAAGGGPGVYPHPGDNNNNGGFSTDNIGRSWDWPDGPGDGDPAARRDEAYFKHLYEIRERIYQDHVSYQQGLVWFLAHDERVPQKVRDALAPWGLTPDSFQETGGFPHALYVREGRRLVGEFVMTEHQCRHAKPVEDSVGLGQYNMDSHNVQRVVLHDAKTAKAYAQNEGDVQVGVPGPYPVAYRSLVPKEEQCANLLVPVCLSSSHIAYGSIRMEPVFMVLGQSAATAAALAIDAGAPVQKVDYAKLRERLLADKQMLEWTGPVKAARGGGGRAGSGIDPAKLPGVVVDDKDAKLTGDWKAAASTGGFIGSGYLHDGGDAKTRRAARFEVPIKDAGEYEVRLAYSPNPNRATNVPVTISGFDGAGDTRKLVKVNERESPPIDRLFAPLGTFRFAAGATAVVEVTNEGADGHVIVDAVQVLPVK